MLFPRPVVVVAPASAPAFVLAALFAASVVADAASADVVNSYYGNFESYNYKINHMPDLDQQRDDLAGNGGMYCAPTSAVNLFAYAANHGYETDNIPDINWQLNASFDDATTAIFLMGLLMSTHPVDGTTCCIGTGLGGFAATNGLLMYTHRNATEDYNPGVSKVTKLACQGWIMAFAYGKYAVVGQLNGYPLLSRYGGHVVTLQRSYRNGSNRILRYRDPATDDVLPTQSVFTNKRRNPYDYAGYFPHGLRTMAALFAVDGKTRVLDGHFGIRPMFGLTFIGDGVAGAGGGTIKSMDPVPFEGSPGTMLPEIVVPAGLVLKDMILNPGEGNALVLATSSVLPLPNRLRTLDLATGEISILDPSPAGLVKIDVSRNDWICAFDTQGLLYRMRPDGTVQYMLEAIPEPTDIAINDADDTIWVLSVPERKLVQVYKDFSETLLTLNLPASMPMSGDGTIVIDPASIVPCVKTAGSPFLWSITYTMGEAGPIVTATPTTLPGVIDIGAIHTSSDGRLFVVGDGSVRVFKKNTQMEWISDAQSPFDGLPGGSFLTMLKSTTNYDPDLHGGPGYANLLPADLQDDAPSLADCDADLNGDEQVDGADLGELLGFWGQDGAADLDGDDFVNGADLGTLLGAWGPCP